MADGLSDERFALGVIHQTIASPFYQLWHEMSLACGWLPLSWGKYIVTGGIAMPDPKDYDKIRDMEYDPDRGRFVGKDEREFRVTPFSDGSGYKYDYYDRSTYGNTIHNSTHIKSDLNENWTRVDNDRDNGTSTPSSGSGCYLTSACMMHMQEYFNDNCEELTILRWFRDKFVSENDIRHYYAIAPAIVEKINKREDSASIYSCIYENIIIPCVSAIKKGDYDFAYTTYKKSVLDLEKHYC